MVNRSASRMRRAVAAAGAIAVAFTAAPASATTPIPRDEEWWFSTWDITNKVWPISTGRGVIVAVLDTGINARLPDLSSVVLSGVDLTGKEDDGRIDFDAKDGGHGTGMAALIAGQGPNMVGVAPGAKILPVTMYRHGSSLQSYDSEIRGIRYAVRRGAKVISMSNGFGDAEGPLQCDDEMQGAVDYAVRHDAVLVAAAGNDGDTLNDPQSPAACPGVVGVGSVDSQPAPAVETQRQPYVAVAAPGVDVGSIGRAGIFGNNRGTSSATALTAGVVALVRAKFPKMSGREVVQRIIASALDVGPHGVDQQTGYGLLRPYHALVDHVPANAPNPVYERWDQAQRQESAASSPSKTSPARAPTVTKTHKKPGGAPFGVIGGIVLGALCVLGGVVLLLVRRGRGREALE